MKKSLVLLLFCFLSLELIAQIKSPAAFLGYEPGSRFTPYYRVVEYLQHLKNVSPNIKLQQYGESYEGRPLYLAYIASEHNLDRIEAIRKSNLTLCGLESSTLIPDQPAVVWLSYNVHGNEAVSTEAALQTLYRLLEPGNADVQAWLRNLVIIIDPCLNPDGRERYVNFYTSVKNIQPDPLPFTREHDEPWPGGRFNHYGFDLNRDWAWQSQQETQQRMKIYNQWMPQVHIDFHEQGYDEPYYFAPAAEPLHQDISAWQREFQMIAGKKNAAYFDQKGWLYFTRERFDLLYPSYGDTYPMYNGAIGMTYEQGGSGKAGLVVINSEEDTLTLADRIEHHYAAGLSTLATASEHSEKLLREFAGYFKASRERPPGTYKTYVLKAESPSRLAPLAELLRRNGIKFGYGQSGNARGFHYLNGKTQQFKFEKTDMIISAYQPKSVLLKVLFEPHTTVTDSVTYDITSWAIPYAFCVDAYALKEARQPLSKAQPEEKSGFSDAPAVAYLAEWNSLSGVKFLAALLRQNIRVRYSEVQVDLGDRVLQPGTLVVPKPGNDKMGKSFDDLVQKLAVESGASVWPVYSGLAPAGPDLGSTRIKHIKKPRPALILGEKSDPSAFGEVWHFFEQQISYPLSVIKEDRLAGVNLAQFNEIIIPDGEYEQLPHEKLMAWIADGGKLILMKGAIQALSGKKGYNIQSRGAKESDAEALAELIPYAKRERSSLKSAIPGAVFRVNMDNTHPLAFGLSDHYFTMKLDNRSYELLPDGWNVGVLAKNSYIAGLVGSDVRKKLDGGMLFAVENVGKGSIIYLADNPLFRSFWESGKLLFSNAVFVSGN